MRGKDKDYAATMAVMEDERRRITVNDVYDYDARLSAVLERHPIWTATELSVGTEVYRRTRNAWAFRITGYLY